MFPFSLNCHLTRHDPYLSNTRVNIRWIILWKWILAPSQVFEGLLKENCIWREKKELLAEKEGIQERRIKSESYWNRPYCIGEDCPNLQHSWSQMSKNHEIWELAKGSNSSLWGGAHSSLQSCKDETLVMLFLFNEIWNIYIIIYFKS